ncbi:iron complex outermembrane receptor protein [Natronospira proteinivora]|uniref:Iron complex outermembrane receptor protein n=1 Tax=Natronospira proteinivora TaxID=1807133 RepID=A0ABT1G5W3_9GAMM|nr:TonB-dependent receptor [Natronospira proteinivora]MCP1726684.1 iron complex outermembrane receptor protein [Natronospira proteinivora]
MTASVSHHWTALSSPVILAALTAWTNPAYAGNEDDAQGLLTEDAYLESPARVLTGSRLRQARDDSPVSVTVIDREMIKASGAREIQELLRYVPGAVVSYTSGHWSSVVMGFGAESYSRRLEVLVDGRSVYTPSFGGVPWPSLPYSVSDIERIEVTRGPNTSAFGTNAFLGTINIITRDPADRSGGEIEVLAGDDYAHRAQYRQFGSSDRTDWSISTAQWGDNGFDNQRLEFDGKSHRFINTQLRYHTGPNSNLHARAGVSRGRQEWGRDHPAFEPPRDQYWKNHFGQLNWEYQTDSGQLLEFRIHHSEEDIDETFHTRPIVELDFAEVPVDESRVSSRSDIEFQHTLRLSETSRILWGLGAREDKVESPQAYFPDGPEKNRSGRVFTQLEWQPTPDYTMNLGAMYEDDQIVDGAFSPRLALNRHLGTNHTLRLSASRATRSPVLIEELGDWSIDMPLAYQQVVLASGGLERETVDSVELGHLYESPTHSLTIDTRIHHDHIQDMIMYISSPVPEDPFDGEAVDFANLENARITGLETSLEWRPMERIRLNTSYAYKKIDSPDQSGTINDSAPRHSMSLLGQYEFNDRTRISLSYFYYSEYQLMNLGARVNHTRRADMRIAHTMGSDDNAPRLALVIQSLSGDYRDTWPRNRFHRRIFGEIRIPF